MNHPKEITDAELWDDSSLIDTWDQALEEYKKYHSVQARSPKNKKNSQEHIQDIDEHKHDPSEKPSDESVKEKLETAHDVEYTPSKPILDSTPLGTADCDEPMLSPNTKAEQAHAPPVMFPPGNFTEDEALRNLMMSWYFAGYYTAVYERSRQQQQSQHQSQG